MADKPCPRRGRGSPFPASHAVDIGCVSGPKQHSGKTAENFPHKPITIVAPFSAGGSTDMLARVMAKALSAQFGSQVIVENKAGAGGTIGAAYVARAAADGYTLLLSSVTFTSLTVLYKNLSYDFSRDLVGVSMLGQVPLILEVNKGLGIKTGQAFMDYLRAVRSDEVRTAYASMGMTPDTRGGEAFAQVIAQDTLRWSKLLRDIGIEPP